MLIIVNNKTREIIWFNTVSHELTNLAILVRTYLKEEIEGKQYKDLVNTKYTIKRGVCPVQNNNYDCGVFICLLAKHVARGESRYPGVAQMGRYRQRMRREILTKRLKEKKSLA